MAASKEDTRTDKGKGKADAKKPIGIDLALPLAILGSGDHQGGLRKKLLLIRNFQLADPEALVRILKEKTLKAVIPSEDQTLLERLWKATELDDLDLTELFICFLPRIIDRQDSKALASLDPRPEIHKHLHGDRYEEFVRQGVRKSAIAVERFALPRVRAKLAVREIICLITSDPRQIADLIRISPRYLACPSTVDLIAKLKSGQLSSDAKVRRRTTDALATISRAILGTPKRQSRRYGYWKIDSFFNEVLECIKISNKIQKIAERRDYIRSVDRIWKLPEGYPDILFKGTKSPAEITLEMMVAKGMIADASTYRNVIKPHVKRLKTRYPALRACDFLVEHLLDIPTKDPDRFSQIDLWQQLESFRFNLTENELKTGHAISYPTHVIGV